MDDTQFWSIVFMIAFGLPMLAGALFGWVFGLCESDPTITDETLPRPS